VDEFLSRPLGPDIETEDSVDPPRLETVVTRAEAVRALEKKLGPEPGAWVVDDAVSLEVLLEDEGRHAEAEAICRTCLQRTDPDGMRVRAVLLLAMGRIHRRRGQVDAALKWLEQALQAMEKSPSRTILLEIHLEVSGLLRERGEILRAFDHALRGLRTAFECGKTLGLAHAILELTGLLDETGHDGPAGLFARAAWELARGKGLLLPELRATRWILELGACGEKERESLLGSWRKLGETVGSAADSCTRDLALGRFAFARQSFAEALASAKAALDVARSAGLHPQLERGLLVLAAVESAPANPRKNFLRALEVLEQVIADAETRGYPRVQFEALERLSKLYEERGKGDYAEELAAKARNLAHRVFQGLPPVLVSSPWRTSLEGQGDPLLIGSGTPAGAVKQSS
jgi:tetratricopeptide (TPR) repeat protein